MSSATRTHRLHLKRSLLVLGAFGLGALTASQVANHEASNLDREQVAQSQVEKVAHQSLISTNKKPPVVDLSPLDLDTLAYEALPNPPESDQDCSPRTIRRWSGISVKFLDCPVKVWESEGQAVVISEEFTLSPALARRFHFWRRIYSLWSKDHYILHLAPWPEVVIEAYETLARDATKSVDDSRDIKKYADDRREAYALLLRTMHEKRDSPEEYTPAMRRLEKAMAHIAEPNKYLTAAESLRVQRGQKDYIAQGLKVAPKYLPWIEREFAALGVPREISLLAFIESSFNLRALSRVGASGVYQIMPETGKQYLRIQNGIDERNDPLKAGRAAARLLRFYYNTLGSWSLAITAYNHGVGGIRKAIESTGSNRIEDLVSRYEGNAFGFASKNFYTGFLGIVATLAKREVYFPGLKSAKPLKFRTIKMPSESSIVELRKRYGMSAAEMLAFNPDISPQIIRKNGVLPKNYLLKVPAGAADRLAALDADQTTLKDRD